MQLDPQQNHTDETRHWIIPHKFLSNIPGGVQASGTELDPHWKPFLILFSRWDVVCLCIHWVVQNTKQHPFLIHASSVYTICVLEPWDTKCLGLMDCQRSWEPYSLEKIGFFSSVFRPARVEKPPIPCLPDTLMPVRQGMGILFTSSRWVWVAPSTTLTLWSLQGNVCWFSEK